MSRTIEVSDETYEKIKDQLSEEEIEEVESLDDLIGKTSLKQEKIRAFVQGLMEQGYN